MLMRKRGLKTLATLSLIFILGIVMMSMVSAIRVVPIMRIENPWEVEISTPWELQQAEELVEIKEAEVPEWYRGHGELTPPEAKALEEYKVEYPEMELGEKPVPCTINGVKGILTEKQGHISVYYGPVEKKLT